MWARLKYKLSPNCLAEKSLFPVVSSVGKTKLPVVFNKHAFSSVASFVLVDSLRKNRNSQITVPGSQLVLTPPGEFTKALVALVVVVKHTVQCRSAQVHQSVVSCLLLLPTGVAVKQVIYLICNFWKYIDKRGLTCSFNRSRKRVLTMPNNKEQYRRSVQTLFYV